MLSGHSATAIHSGKGYTRSLNASLLRKFSVSLKTVLESHLMSCRRLRKIFFIFIDWMIWLIRDYSGWFASSLDLPSIKVMCLQF